MCLSPEPIAQIRPSINVWNLCSAYFSPSQQHLVYDIQSDVSSTCAAVQSEFGSEPRFYSLDTIVAHAWGWKTKIGASW